MFYLIQVIIIAFLIRGVVQYMTHDPSAEHARVLQAATRRRLSVRPPVTPLPSTRATRHPRPTFRRVRSPPRYDFS